MKDILEVVQGISQAVSNKSAGAVDEDGEQIKIGLKREEGEDFRDPKVNDGFVLKIKGCYLCVTYHCELPLKDTHDKNFKQEMNQILSDIVSYIKKEYKKSTKNALTLTKDGEAEINVDYISRVRVSIRATQMYKIGGIEDEIEKSEKAEDKLNNALKEWYKKGPRGRLFP